MEGQTVPWPLTPMLLLGALSQAGPLLCAPPAGPWTLDVAVTPLTSLFTCPAGHTCPGPVLSSVQPPWTSRLREEADKRW